MGTVPKLCVLHLEHIVFQTGFKNGVTPCACVCIFGDMWLPVSLHTLSPGRGLCFT